MCMQSNPVVLLQDTTLQSERDGSRRIYWAPASTFTAFREGTALECEWFVHSTLNDPATSLYAQVSADGKSWEDLPDAEAGGLLGGTITNTEAGNRGQARLWIGQLLSNASFVRFGIQVEDPDDPTTQQVEITLTLTVTPRTAGGSVQVADQASPGTVASDTELGPKISLTDAKSVNFFVTSYGLEATGKFYKLDVKTAATPDAAEWLDTGLTITVTEGGVTSGILTGEAALFSNYAQVFVDDTSDSTAGFITIWATVRPNH